MTLRFVSDASINRKGFAVQFSSALCEFRENSPSSQIVHADLFSYVFAAECGEGFFNVTRGIRTLSSPHYPEKYPLGIRCQWVLADAVAKSAEAERIINIHVVEWDLEDGDSLTFRATVVSVDFRVLQDSERSGPTRPPLEIEMDVVGGLPSVAGRQWKLHGANFNALSRWRERMRR